MGVPHPPSKLSYPLDPMQLLHKYAPLRMIFRFNADKIRFEGLTQLPIGKWSWDHEHVYVFASQLHQMEPQVLHGLDGSVFVQHHSAMKYPGDAEAEHLLKCYGDPSAFLLDPLDTAVTQRANLQIGWIDWLEGKQVFEICNAPFTVQD
jgi:hypothetical protein